MGAAIDRVWELARDRDLTLRQAALVDRDPRGRGRAECARVCFREPRPRRDAVRPGDARRPTRRAREAAEHLVRPDVRVVLVVDGGGALVGVVTPDALVERVVAAGLRPAHDAARRGGGRARCSSSMPICPWTTATGCSRRPRSSARRCSRSGRLVGVLSRSVVQRRLTEDEAPEEVPDPEPEPAEGYSYT